MNIRDWIIVKNALQGRDDLSSDVSDILENDWESVQRLPEYDGTGSFEEYRPSIERKAVQPDYLEFLEQQIRLNARGSDWTDVLRKRRDAIRPFLGQDLITVQFFDGTVPFTYKIDPHSERLVYSE